VFALKLIAPKSLEDKLTQVSDFKTPSPFSLSLTHTHTDRTQSFTIFWMTHNISDDVILQLLEKHQHSSCADTI